MKKIIIILIIIATLVIVSIFFHKINALFFTEETGELTDSANLQAGETAISDTAAPGQSNDNHTENEGTKTGETDETGTTSGQSETNKLNNSQLNPANLQLLSSIDFDTPTYGLDVDDENNYAIVGRNYAVDIVNIENVEAIKLASSFKKEEWSENTGWAIKTLVSNNYAFLGENYKLDILKIEDIKKPEIISELDIEGFDIKMDLSGDILYLASSRVNEDWYEVSKIYSIDISKKESPFTRSEISIAEPAYSFLKIGQNLMIGSSGKLFTVDINDGEGLTGGKEIAAPGWINDLELKDQMYMLAAGSEGLTVFDIADSGNPRITATLDIRGYGQQIDIYKEDYAFILCNSRDSKGDIALVNISDPSFPELVKVFDLEGVPRQICLAGDCLLVSSTEQYEYKNEDEPPEYISGKLSIYKIIINN